DQVETVLLRVLRGSAPAGLAGIPARARGGLVRPLLAFTRAELAAHVVAQRLAAHEDPANRDPRHLRSWIRLELLPLIERPLGGEWIAEVAFAELRVYRSVACAADQVVATGERGGAVFGAFRVAWRPEAAPERVERAAWTTWIAASEWQLRAPRAGDRVSPLGGVGRRPLRRLLMEARVPRSERGRYPVVARGETILWVPGVCRSAADLPGPGTPA